MSECVVALIRESLILFSVVIELFSSGSADGTNYFLKFEHLVDRKIMLNVLELLSIVNHFQPIVCFPSFFVSKIHFPEKVLSRK